MKLKLGRRNLFYSMILAGCMLTFLVGYFVYMLPSLYVDYTMEQNLKAIKEQHRSFVETGTYKEVQIKNPTSCFSVKIPDDGESIFITSKMFSAEIKVTDERLMEIFTELREYFKDYNGQEEFDAEGLKSQFEEKGERWAEILQEVFSENLSLPFQIQMKEFGDMENGYQNEYGKMHLVSDEFVVFEMGIEDANNKYVNYMAVGRKEDSLIMTYLPVMTPDMNEIRPIVLQSIPMLGAVIFLLVLLFSQAYSRGIVTPIVQLVRHTQLRKDAHAFEVSPMEEKWEKRGDEIGMLAVTIEELYQKLRASYEELEEKNQKLEEENKRQEVLLRASSHQLKTPISAALLLVDGMKNNIGKYQDREKYLPKVKEQLLSMKKMVEDILFLNHCGENLDFENVEIRKVLETQLALYRITITDRQLNVSIEGLPAKILYTDETALTHILSNLLSNAVNYTPSGERIRILLEEEKLTIQNQGSHIDEELLPHIFDPFVSGSHNQKESNLNSHGLGLYIASYYAKKTSLRIKINNIGDSVVTLLYFS